MSEAWDWRRIILESTHASIGNQGIPARLATDASFTTASRTGGKCSSADNPSNNVVDRRLHVVGHRLHEIAAHPADEGGVVLHAKGMMARLGPTDGQTMAVQNISTASMLQNNNINDPG
jgi:hypothetical protein